MTELQLHMNNYSITGAIITYQTYIYTCGVTIILRVCGDQFQCELLSS